MDIERKRLVWAKEDEVRAAETRRDETLARAFELYTQALGDDPENQRARAGLAGLHFDQLIEAESWGRFKEARRLESQIRRLDDGRLKAALQGDGRLKLVTDPINAEAWLYDLVERDRRVQAVVPRLLGRTPLEVNLPRRRYLLVLKTVQRGREREFAYPIVIKRLGEWDGLVRLYTSIPEEFILVPGGPFIYGGDRQAAGAGQREERWVDDFAIQRFPVTCTEYLQFLSALHELDPGEAVRRAPRPSGTGGRDPLWPYSREAGFRIPRVDILGGRWAPDMPVRCVSREDADAYAAWRSRRDNISFRLPTEFEWEKAGRGVDGRWFPWGNEFDASFCKMKDSRPGPPEPEPVGAFEHDCSPYGVRDLAGGVIEWCSGPFDRHGLLGIQKGGFWIASQASCRLARRFGVFPSEPEPFGGFRLAFTPHP
jgi:serine/threonine-protein kinase